MPSFKINDEEWNALYEEPPHLFKLYCAIRRFMNYETRIAGLEPRRLSEAYFKDVLNSMPVRGRSKNKSKDFTRQAVRSSLDRLEAIGLLKPLGQCVFECVLAAWDNSDQNISNRSATTTTTLSATKKIDTNILKNNNNQIDQQPHQQSYDVSISNQSPVSGINNISTNVDILSIGAKKTRKPKQKKPQTFIDPNFEITQAHVNYAHLHGCPHPSLELPRFINHWQSKGETKADWNAAFRNWLLKARDFKQQEKTHDSRHPGAKALQLVKPNSSQSFIENCRQFALSDKKDGKSD